ncbi:MAG: hypothetical protein KVP17_004458 [Porospora cf. gigantea B]|uniref:uncharacterized protein n=1 Tax=Porospora cf. gigantea B TaxID=2853592 RepID=UPI003571F016|nr:MAG: hypothetical protein KVP17_004458 [Porospora cf. gigantea B]
MSNILPLQSILTDAGAMSLRDDIVEALQLHGDERQMLLKTKRLLGSGGVCHKQLEHVIEGRSKDEKIAVAVKLEAFHRMVRSTDVDSFAAILESLGLFHAFDDLGSRGIANGYDLCQQRISKRDGVEEVWSSDDPQFGMSLDDWTTLIDAVENMAFGDKFLKLDAAPRTVQCSIHGEIVLQDCFWNVVDTPYFMRLGQLKQLGPAYHIYPSAEHSRKPHSLGVSHLCWMWSEKLLSHRLGLSPQCRQVLTSKTWVAFAGLVHDIGHGPWGHFYDTLRPALDDGTNSLWAHEDRSIKIMDKIWDNAATYGCEWLEVFTKAERQRIEESIRGVSYHYPRDTRNMEEYDRALTQIISNGVSGVDADRIDYLLRDSAMCSRNLRPSFDYERIFNHSSIAGGHVVYESKIHEDVLNLGRFRFRMFDSVYLHPKALGAEHLLFDMALLLSDYWKYNKINCEPDLFAQLTDATLLAPLDRDDCASVIGHEFATKGKELLERFRSRNLYRFVHEFCFFGGNEAVSQLKQQVARLEWAKAGFDFRTDLSYPWRFRWQKADAGSQDRQPLSSAGFFRDHATNAAPLQDFTLKLHSDVPQKHYFRVHCVGCPDATQEKALDRMMDEFEELLQGSFRNVPDNSEDVDVCSGGPYYHRECPDHDYNEDATAFPQSLHHLL